MGFMFDTPKAPQIEEPAQQDPATDQYRQREIERRRLLARNAMNTRDLLINPSVANPGNTGLSNPR